MRGLKLAVGEAPKFPIADLYIPLLEETSARGEGKTKGGMEIDRKRRPLEELMTERCLVLLGDPGSGKTTFLRRRANEACKKLLEDATAPFPIFLRISELAKFAEKQSEWDVPLHIADCLEKQCVDLGFPMGGGFFRDVVTKGPCLLLLDGLDEAPNDALRAAMARLIDRAARAWTNTRFVITTRPKAYQGEVSLPVCTEASIGPLEPEAIRTFLERWSWALLEENPARARSHAQELIAAVEGRADIRLIAANPVMLTALALLHWNEMRMPEQRADLYDSILKWLALTRRQITEPVSAEGCIKALQELAGAMHLHPSGRQVQVSREWAAEQMASQFQGDSGRAMTFLRDLEVDSGIIVNRGVDIKFWHLTFQEFLTARLLSAMGDGERNKLLFSEGRAWQNEWREVVLLLVGIQHGQRVAQVDALVSAALDSFGDKKDLVHQAQCFGRVGAMLRDLHPLAYQPADARFGEMKQAVLGIFEKGLSPKVDLQTRVAAAEALGQAGDPRLRLPEHKDYWVTMPAGKFAMGDDEDDDTPIHDVTLESYQLGRYPVTVYEYGLFLEATGHDNPHGWDEQALHPNRPVVNVSWHDADAYCRWTKVRLPTEAQWERAARGTEGRRYAWGDDAPSEHLANYYDLKIHEPTPVGLFPRGSTPDPECLADMTGNVDEWVADWYEENFYKKKAAAVDPQGPKSGDYKCLRGGSWGDGAADLRAAFRVYDAPVYRHGSLGFRCSREVIP